MQTLVYTGVPEGVDVPCLCELLHEELESNSDHMDTPGRVNANFQIFLKLATGKLARQLIVLTFSKTVEYCSTYAMRTRVASIPTNLTYCARKRKYARGATR